MKKFVMLIMFMTACNSDNHDEIQIMNTFCDKDTGILMLSGADGLKVFHTPLTIEGEIVRCSE